MSVFSDFQRMWMMRFPDNSLSSEWEDDVKASLQRHKQKIVDLSKELEQEMLYVEYLERLLSDVEQYRKSGRDPTAAPADASDGEVATANGGQPIDNRDDKSDDIGSATNNEQIQQSATIEVRVVVQ